MSTKTKLIIALLFLVQIGVLIWSRYNYEAKKTPFEKQLDFYLDNNKNVKFVDFSRLQLKKLPSSILKLKNIEKIDLSHNELEDFPDILYDFPFLKEINLSNNRFFVVRFLPSKTITHINLDNNYIQHVEGQSDIQNLRNISLVRNKLQYFPFFHKGQNLDTINLARNYIEGFINDNMLELVENINYLNLAHNEIRGFENIKEVAKNSRSVNLSYNFQPSLKDFEYEVAKEILGGKVKHLDISHCVLFNFNTFPPNQLQSLNLEGNNFVITTLDKLTELQSLKLRYLKLQNLSYHNPNLKELNVTNTIIEGELNLNLPNLERLLMSVNRNFIEHLPDFPNLKTIQCVYDKTEENDYKQYYQKLQSKYPNAKINFSPSETN